MTDNEKIQKAEQLIAEANALLNEVKANNDKEDMIAKYKEDYCKGKKYYIGDDDSVHWVVSSIRCTFENTSDPYKFYLTEELAEQAKNIKDFNDKLLAFKYCYDRDYRPDWADDGSPKYTVVWNVTTNRFDCVWSTLTRCNYVFFSTEEIAQKCADWLNCIN